MNPRTDGRELLACPTSSDPIAQVYQDEAFLAEAVVGYQVFAGVRARC